MMAKNSRVRIGAPGCALALILVVFGALPVESAVAAGLPLRAEAGPSVDPALASLAEGLDFKLNRAAQAGFPAWAAMVEETVLVARRLGWSGHVQVTPHRFADTYGVVLEGEAIISGKDADQVLGRLLYMLAHDPIVAPTASALAVLDQPLSATLAALSPVLSP